MCSCSQTSSLSVGKMLYFWANSGRRFRAGLEEIRYGLEEIRRAKS